MSERGSFVTEYIYCPKCLEGAGQVLRGRDSGLFAFKIPHLPIIAGKIGVGHAGGELELFASELAPKLSHLLCHPLRVAVLAEIGEEIFTVEPQPKVT